MTNEKLKMPSSACAQDTPFSQREKVTREAELKIKRDTLSLWERVRVIILSGEGFNNVAKRHIHLSFVICSFVILLAGIAEALPISNPELTSLSDNSVVITWSTTNDANASTEILWGSGGLTNIATGPVTSSTAVISGNTKYHYVELKGLYQNTTYQYRIKSGSTVFPLAPLISPLTFTTLTKPSGEYLFSFAVLSDLRYAPTKQNWQNARGIAYQYADKMISSEVADINAKQVDFTVINGNIADSTKEVTYNTQISTDLKNILEQLDGSRTPSSPAAYKYLPTTGFNDKKAKYADVPAGNDWMTYNLLPITTNPGTTESRYTSLYGYNAASRDADSVFNYSFKHKYYDFIFLDSVKTDGTGSASIETLYRNLSAESNSKTFIFMSYPAYNPLASDTKDYPLDIPTEEVGGSLCISNHVDFRTTLEAFKDAAGNPIVAAVISGHLGDNYKRDIHGVSYVRQGPAIQYPTGYSVYKVYSTGYVKTFYKTTGGSIESDGDFKPWYEYARDQISSGVAGGQEIPKEVLTQFWLGSNSSRNFTYQYAFIPGLAPRILSTSPASTETAVTLNSPILLTFNKRMSDNVPSNVSDWCSISPSLGTLSASFIDSSKTILKISHPDFTSEESYAITLSASQIMDEGLSTMESNYAFSFSTFGGKKDEAPPSAAIFPLPNNSTTDPFPNLTGIATDESRVITVQYCFNNKGNWATTEAVDGQFTGSVEVFQIKPTSPLTAGSHQVWLKTSDGAGNISATGFKAYDFTVAVGDKPVMTSLKIDGNRILPGDPIAATPKIEVTITSNNSLESARITIDINKVPFSNIAKVDTNYYATYEVGSALSDGIHGITIEAFDILGNGLIYEVYPLYVRSAVAVSVQGVPLNYPNPFDPGDPNNPTTKISYVLSKPANITLSIFDLAGNLIAKKSFNAGETGGKAGYNEVSWDGKSDAGQVIGNGIYVYLIIADGKVVSRGKITVLKQ